MDVSSDAVANQISNDGVAVVFDVLLNLRADIPNPCPCLCLSDALHQAFTGHIQQPFGLLGNLTYRECPRAVSMKIVFVNSKVKVNDIALLQNVIVGDSVNHHFVDGDAGSSREPPVSLEAWSCSRFADQPLCEFIEIKKPRLTRFDRLGNNPHGPGKNAPVFPDLGDLGVVFEDDNWASSSLMSLWTASTV